MGKICWAKSGNDKTNGWGVAGMAMSDNFIPAEGVVDKTGATVGSEDLGARGRLPPLFLRKKMRKKAKKVKKIKNFKVFFDNFVRNRKFESLL